MSKTIFVPLTLGLVGAGCVADDAPLLGAAEGDIYVRTGTPLWHGANDLGNRDVPICWEPAQAPAAWDGFASEQALALAQFKRSWQAVSGLRVVDRGVCPTAGSESLIRIRSRGYDLATFPTAYIGGSTKSLGAWNLMPAAVGNDTMSMAIDIPVRWSTAAQRYERQGSDDRLRYVAGHELGHILGFTHEQENEVDLRALQCRTVWGGASVPGTAVTVYDPDSIMNYCQSGGNNTGALTSLDIQGARKLYGWPDTTDYDNDGISNLAVFRPQGPLAGQWFVSGVVWGAKYGEAGDVPIAGDFDGDGVADRAVWRPAGINEGWWFIRNSSGGETRVQWGATGDIPTTGDLNGDGRNELIVYRPSSRTFYIREPSGATRSFGPWGEAGDIPVLADYDGDGITDLALFRPEGPWAGSWFVLDSTTPGRYRHVVYGAAGDIPVTGDFDGDRRSDFAVWRPSNGWWYVKLASGASEIRTKFGEPGDVPVSLDYNGDAITELSVWRPSNGTWYISTPSAWLAIVQMGEPGDIPLGRTIR